MFTAAIAAEFKTIVIKEGYKRDNPGEREKQVNQSIISVGAVVTIKEMTNKRVVKKKKKKKKKKKGSSAYNCIAETSATGSQGLTRRATDLLQCQAL